MYARPPVPKSSPWMGHLGDTPAFRWFHLPFHLGLTLALLGELLEA